MLPIVSTSDQREACALTSLTAHNDLLHTYDSDAKVILVDNCCTASITNDIKDFVTLPRPTKTNVEGYNGMTEATKVGTIKWDVEDDAGRTHTIILPNSYYAPTGKYKLLCLQHWAQVANDHFPKPNGTWCATYSNCIVLHWAQGKYTQTLRLVPSTNVGVLTTKTGITMYQKACHAMEKMNQPIVLPTFIEPIREEIDTSPPLTQSSGETTKSLRSARPVTPDPETHDAPRDELSRMPKVIPIEEPFKDPMEDHPGNTVSARFDLSLLQEEDVSEPHSELSRDEQEMMLWHLRLSHLPLSRLLSMARLNLLPRRL
jgi:hypothetical protein